jgi:hypothetical protein
MGPVAINSATVIERNQLVRVVSGLVTTVADAATAGLALSAEKMPDAEYAGGPKPAVGLIKLGEDCEVEMPFSGAALTQAMIGGGPYNILAANGGTVNLALTAAGVFKPLRLGRNTKIGDTTGFLVGVFTDASTF